MYGLFVLLKLIKYVDIFFQVLDDGVADVREAAAKAFGTLSLVVGDRAIQGYIAKLDPIKQKKVKDSTPQNLPPAAMAALAAPPPPEPSSSAGPSEPAKLMRAPSIKKEEKKVEEKKDKVVDDEPVVVEKKSSLQQTVSRPPPRVEVIADDASSSSSLSSKGEDSKPPVSVLPLLFILNGGFLLQAKTNFFH